MSTFFDNSTLTSEQRSRWDAAILEYNRVQESNSERRFKALTAKDRAWLKKEYKATTDAEIMEHMRVFARLSGNQPGNSKSALFNRLLEGKPALPSPPPTSHSYPWYSVVENAGPHRVMIGGAMTAGGLMKGAGGAKAKFAIGINQCQWAVRSFNDAARMLMELDKELQRVAKKPDPQSEWSSIYEWPEDLLERVKAAYAGGPEFIVQHGDWPEYRLYVGQLDGADDCHRSNKKHAKEKLLGGVRFLTHVGSVFDLDALDLNARIGKTLSKGVHPQVRLDEARARYAQLLASHTDTPLPFTALFDKEAADKQMESLEADVRDFEANPDNNDWVEFFLDMWYLEKVLP